MFTADFETVNCEEDCRVWAWALCDIDTLEHTVGKDIASFIDHILKKGGEKYYFHNLKFDGNFICSYLLNNGWVHSFEQVLNKKEFKCTISDKGQFYAIKLCWTNKKGKKFYIEILDSLKLIPFSVAKIAKDFDLPISKGEIDYNAFRPVGYEMTPEEKEYIVHDVEIMARALKIFFNDGLTGMTIGANALKFYKNMIGGRTFRKTISCSVL